MQCSHIYVSDSRSHCETVFPARHSQYYTRVARMKHAGSLSVARSI